MSRIHSELEYKDFEFSNSLVKRSVCSETGLLPYVSDGEPGSPSSCKVVTEYFPEGTEPTRRCQGHEPVAVEEDDDVADDDVDVTDENQGAEDEDAGTTPPTEPSTPPAPTTPTPSQPSTPTEPTPPAESTDPAAAADVASIDLFADPFRFFKRLFTA